MNPQDDTPRPSRKMREMARYRREILDVAIALFAEHGFHATTMQMIADRSEFSVGYLYKHFPGKEDMYREMFLFHMDKLDRILADVEARRLPPIEMIHESYVAVCRYFNQHTDFMRIYHGELGIEFPEAERLKREHLTTLREALDRAVADGTLRTVDTHLLATVLEGAIKELFHELAADPTDEPFDPIPRLLFELVINPLRV